MTISKDVMKIEAEVRAYLEFMSSQGKAPSCVYLTTAQIAKLKKQTERNGGEWHNVIDGYPIKVWNP